MSLFEPLLLYLRDLCWRDVLEIGFFTTIIYALQVWLRHDRQKSLLGYWYLYYALWITAYFANLSTISHALLILLPATITMFVLVHQRTLQRNFIALRNIAPTYAATEDWLEVIMQTALTAMNSNKPFWCVIEQRDSLTPYVATPLSIHAPLKKDLLTMLVDSSTFDAEKFVWITSQGELKGINSSWQNHANTTLSNEAKTTWLQDALFFTSMTDALILYANQTTRTFTFVAGGTASENIYAHQAHLAVKRHQLLLNPSVNQGGTIHGSYRVRSSTTQQSQS